MNELRCPRCRRPVPGPAINTEAGMALCAACAEVFRLPAPSSIRQRPELPCPPGITVREEDETLRITRRWFRFQWLVALLFCGPFLLLGIFIIAVASASQPGLERLGMSVPFLAPVIITYLSLANVINRTEIRATHERVIVRHGPIPATKNREVATVDIDQFYSVRIYNGQNARDTYGVDYVTPEGDRRPLIAGLATADQAHFIEQQLERALGINDREVVGELSDR